MSDLYSHFSSLCVLACEWRPDEWAYNVFILVYCMSEGGVCDYVLIVIIL